MKLEELGEVYLESAKKLDEIINHKKQELKVAKRKGDLQNIYFLQRDLCLWLLLSYYAEFEFAYYESSGFDFVFGTTSYTWTSTVKI